MRHAHLLGALGLSLGILTMAASPAAAAVTGTSGAVSTVATPVSLAAGITTSDTAIRALSEKQVTLAASLTMSSLNASGAWVSTTYSAGACVRSNLLHFNRTAAAGTISLTGTASFDGSIIGVLKDNDAVSAAAFVATDLLVGTASAYPPAPVIGSTRGLETGDSITYSGGTATVTMSGAAGTYDEVRVFTDCTPPPVVPEVPWTVLLPLSGVAVVGAGVLFNRRRPRAIA